MCVPTRNMGVYYKYLASSISLLMLLCSHNLCDKESLPPSRPRESLDQIPRTLSSLVHFPTVVNMVSREFPLRIQMEFALAGSFGEFSYVGAESSHLESREKNPLNDAGSSLNTGLRGLTGSNSLVRASPTA